MLKSQDIICIASIDWDFVWQGHQEVMSTFAKNGNRVLFIENTGVRAPTFKDLPRLKKRIISWYKSIRGFRQVSDNLYIYSPVILPFPYFRLARWINKFLLLGPIKKWMRAIEFNRPIIWTFLPTGTALDIINGIDSKLLVYYCIADFYELVDHPEKIRKTEDELIKRSDLIFAQGRVLEQKCRRFNRNVHIFPFGVKIEAFDNSRKEVPLDMKDIPKPVIGYIGGIHKHIDFDLIKFIAQSHPGWSVVLIGPLQVEVDLLKDLRNVFFLGKKDFLTLPAYVSQFDVSIVPYAINSFTLTVMPTKLNEYHAMGKPVVATDLPEIANFNAANDNLVSVAKTKKEFVGHIAQALNNNSQELADLRVQSAKKNSWASRIEKMSGLIEEILGEKVRASLNWQEKFINFYKTHRNKAVNFYAAILLAYVLLFYTPLAWFLASPLKISESVRSADAIVVFAGGVGESGKAGQGYEERIGYAVDLYKRGYAPNLIFSSGYAYRFKETQVMKMLAVSLGVPEDSILLEDKATNTYQNVKFSSVILDKKGWKKILLVSSPYHMRRASLVFAKNANYLKVIYAPIPNSLFYSHDKSHINNWMPQRQIKPEQLRAVLHEYFGILYYLFKGYI